MKIPIHVIDAFVRDDPFSGNAAAICILRSDDEISDQIKQKIASQMNLSETVFVANGWTQDLLTEPNKFTLRWFTPTAEVPLCGHATLATARIVFDLLVKDKTNNRIKFETKFNCGELEAVIDRNRHTIEIDFPLIGLKELDSHKNSWIEDMAKSILGPKLDVNLIDDIQYSDELKYLVFILKETKEELVSEVLPYFSRLTQIETNIELKAVIVTQKGDPTQGIHFYSRVFAPWLGVNEDPVCGSGHVVLAPYWKKYYNERDSNFEELIGFQLSRRSGIVICKVKGNRVLLSGKTRSFLSGQIDV